MSENSSTAKPITQHPHKKLWIIAVIIALFGVCTSIYSIKHHMELRLNGHTDASCNINSAVNCDIVAASKYSEVFGIPMGVWGLGYFLGMAFLALTVAVGHRSSKDHEPSWYLLSVMGAVSSIVLGAISLGVLSTVCLVCITVYILTFLQLGLAWKLHSTRKQDVTFNSSTLVGGFSSAAIAVAIAVIGFNFLKNNTPATSEVDNNPARQATGAKPPVFVPSPIDIPVNKSAYSGLGEDYRKGPNEAKFIIIEFADYMCPGCAQTAPVMEDLVKQLGDRAQFVFKNYPLSNKCNSSVQSDMHVHSCDIAKLARCAGNIGKFWEFHTKAFEEQAKASETTMREWGKAVGLSDAQMNECLASPDILAKIRDDVDLGNRAGVNSTPTIYVNGMKYLGERNVEALRSAIENMK